MRNFTCIILLIISAGWVEAQDGKVSFTSDDKVLVEGFDWANNQAMAYVNRGSDPVGHWYEAALPRRFAFCMRDVSHQLVGAQMLGLADINKNLLNKFVVAVADSRDWCGYWEIDKWNRPAPVDYKTDQDFWYNLPANFDIIDACFRAYQWTGDSVYLKDPVYINFYEKSLNEYVNRWDPDGDGLMEGAKDSTTSRGLSSYNEEKFGKVGADLLAGQFIGNYDFAQMLKLRKKDAESALYLQRAEYIRNHLNEQWWDSSEGLYHHYIRYDGTWLNDNQMMSFLLRWNVVPAVRTNAVLDHLLLVYQKSGVEMNTYYPLEFYRAGRKEEGYSLLTRLMSPDLKRREYPEVSYAVLETVAMGVMGIEPDAATWTIKTTSRLTDKTRWAEIKDLPLFDGTINLRHEGNASSKLTNNTTRKITWRAVSHNGKIHSLIVYPGQSGSVLIDR